MASAFALALLGVCVALAAAVDTTLLYEWVTVEYDWSAADRAAAIASGAFIPENNAITGIKVYGDDIYVTVPRWRPGVPSTLNKIVTLPNGTAVLQAFPSWAMNDASSPSNIQYVQSMEIDTNGVMWILDVGRLNIFSANASDIINYAPKLLWYDLNAGTLLRTFVFPDAVAPYNSSFLNDIVIDEVNGVAYISDTGAVGGIVVYDFKANAARRWGGDPTEQHDPSFVISIGGVSYPGISTNNDGIALSPDVQTLYYCPLDGNHLFSIPTKYLRDFTTTDAFLASQVTNLGTKLSASDGLTFGANGMLYFGAFSLNAVVSWDPSTPLTPANQMTVASNASTMQWQDTFAFDNSGNLFFTTNRLQLFFTYTMDFTGASGSNFRVFKSAVGTGSYLTAAVPAYLNAISSLAAAAGIVPQGVPALALDTLLSVSYASEPITYLNPCNMSVVSASGSKIRVDPTSTLGAFGATATRSPPLIRWTPSNSTAWYHLFLFDLDATFLHKAEVNIPGDSAGLGDNILPYFQPSPFDTKVHRYTWFLFRTDVQIVLSPSERLAYFNSPLFSRAYFNMTSYATFHGLGVPIGLTWQLEVVDQYVAYTWRTADELSWIPLSTRQELDKLGYFSTTCKSLMG